jgi:hypothetical protein
MENLFCDCCYLKKKYSLSKSDGMTSRNINPYMDVLRNLIAVYIMNKEALKPKQAVKYVCT